MEPGTIFAQHDPAANDASRQPESAHPPAIGYVGTVVWAVIALVLSHIAGAIFAVLVLGFDRMRALPQLIQVDPTAIYDGALIANVYVASGIAQIAILVLAIQRKGWPVADYLGLIMPSRRAIIPALTLLIAIVVLTDGATYLLGGNPVPEFQTVSYRTAKAAGWLPLLLAVFVAVAPIAEEVLFRGFLYRGFVRQPSHAPYAIVVISIFFALAHQQYDLLGITQVFIMALLLGWIRWLSGSIVLTILMHMLANFIAMAETVVYVEWWHP